MNNQETIHNLEELIKIMKRELDIILDSGVPHCAVGHHIDGLKHAIEHFEKTIELLEYYQYEEI